jgi:fluoroacetyl-CoA thioesterase
MIQEVKIGSILERKITSNSTQTTTFLWDGENVFSTPSMIAEMEETCRLLLKEQFLNDEEWDSVGTLVNVMHIAATPIGFDVLIKSKVTSVDKRRIMFDVEASDDLEKIGSGKHERFIINIPKFRSKFESKKSTMMLRSFGKTIKEA